MTHSSVNGWAVVDRRAHGKNDLLKRQNVAIAATGYMQGRALAGSAISVNCNWKKHSNNCN